MGLELYAHIEEYLEFEDEVRKLHKKFLNILSSKNLKSILDIGCGQGAFLEHLRFNKIEAYGIDLSKKQCEVCQNRGLAVECKPLKKVEERFDCATAIFDVVNYIPNKELSSFFKEAYVVLNQGGYFIFDVNSLFGFEEVAQGSLTINLVDKFIAIDANFEKNRLKTDITLFTQKKEGLYKKEHDSVVQYYHKRDTLEALLKQSQFEVEEILNFNLHSFEENDKLIFVCKKK